MMRAAVILLSNSSTLFFAPRMLWQLKSVSVSFELFHTKFSPLLLTRSRHTNQTHLRDAHAAANVRIKMHTHVCVFREGVWKRTAAPTEKERVHMGQPDRDQVAYYKNRRQWTADATESRAIKRDNEPKTMDETFPVEAEIQSLALSLSLCVSFTGAERHPLVWRCTHMSRLGAQKEAEMPIASAWHMAPKRAQISANFGKVRWENSSTLICLCRRGKL